MKNKMMFLITLLTTISWTIHTSTSNQNKIAEYIQQLKNKRTDLRSLVKKTTKAKKLVQLKGKILNVTMLIKKLQKIYNFRVKENESPIIKKMVETMQKAQDTKNEMRRIEKELENTTARRREMLAIVQKLITTTFIVVSILYPFAKNKITELRNQSH